MGEEKTLKKECLPKFLEVRVLHSDFKGKSIIVYENKDVETIPLSLHIVDQETCSVLIEGNIANIAD